MSKITIHVAIDTDDAALVGRILASLENPESPVWPSGGPADAAAPPKKRGRKTRAAPAPGSAYPAGPEAEAEAPPAPAPVAEVPPAPAPTAAPKKRGRKPKAAAAVAPVKPAGDLASAVAKFAGAKGMPALMKLINGYNDALGNPVARVNDLSDEDRADFYHKLVAGV